ncbi:MAG: EamA family transporter [Haloferacaceae archaeon]
MEYLPWIVVALVAYSLTAPLASTVTQSVPPAPALFLATAVFLVIAGGVIVVTGVPDPGLVVSPAAGIVYVAGVFLTVGILSYVTALQQGPVSVVVPIYGMFIVGSAVIGIVFLDESLTATRAAGTLCAVLAIYLTAGGE